MQTLTISGEDNLLQEIKSLISNFANQKGKKIKITQNEVKLNTKYNSFDDVKADYAQRLEDIKSHNPTPLRDGLEEMMDRVRQKYAN